MKLILGQIMFALSAALDLVEEDVLGAAPHHSKRVACICQAVARTLGLPREETFDLVTLALLHDNGIAETVSRRGSLERGRREMALVESIAEHCRAGERILSASPFLPQRPGVITCHHENHDGSGYFGRRGDEIPVFARIIHLADAVTLAFDLGEVGYEKKNEICGYVRGKSGTLFAPDIAGAFLEAAERSAFWLDLRDQFLGSALSRTSPAPGMELGFAEVRTVTNVFGRIIDSKSRFTKRHSQNLSERAARMAARHGWTAERTAELQIAADLHDVGKLVVDNAILDKPGPLVPPELHDVRRHTYYTRAILQGINGFEEIVEWAANHHEKLDGSGYPYGTSADELDEGSRLLACLDSYQALSEERPYRGPYTHEQAIAVLRSSAAKGLMDGRVVEEIDAEFRG